MGAQSQTPCWPKPHPFDRPILISPEHFYFPLVLGGLDETLFETSRLRVRRPNHSTTVIIIIISIIVYMRLCLHACLYGGKRCDFVCFKSLSIKSIAEFSVYRLLRGS